MVSRNHVLISVHKLVCIFLCYKVYSLLNPCFSCVMLKCAIVSSSRYALFKSVFLKLPHVPLLYWLIFPQQLSRRPLATELGTCSQPEAAASIALCSEVTTREFSPTRKGFLKRNDAKKSELSTFPLILPNINVFPL